MKVAAVAWALLLAGSMLPPDEGLSYTVSIDGSTYD
jgi:hypothetical protein